MHMNQAEMLSCYLERIGLAVAPPADASGIARLQEAHRQSIAFENLDVMLGRAIRIDSESVFDKLVSRGRGYCFEHNRLLADMLAALGLESRPLLARVRLGAEPDRTPPRTHVLLLLALEGSRWIADAGFGGSYVPPMPLEDGATVVTGDGASHRLRRNGDSGTLAGEWLIERAAPDLAEETRSDGDEHWKPQYSFELAEVAPDDLEQANHWTSTRPGTRLTSLHVVSIALPNGFAALNDRQLSISGQGISQVREIANAADYDRALREVFDLALTEQELSALALFA